ncbi:unnamed protein product, partial [Didymodactylos carnosus]
LLVIAVISVGLLYWKRKVIKEWFDHKKGSISNPKPLISFINLKSEDETNALNEYDELNKRSLKINSNDSIDARGLWNRTAVYLADPNRAHDYINANKIKGYYSDEQYIACQGPLPETFEDFWSMILQYKVSKIIMLTKFEEQTSNGQYIDKCGHYFPIEKSCETYGRIKVEVLEVQREPELEIRYLQNNHTQHVTHYFFTGWPDRGVVECRQLVDLIQMINKNTLRKKYKRHSESPIVVHGRSFNDVIRDLHTTVNF